MKWLVTLAFCIILIKSSAQSPIDSSLAKKITISRFCLCKTTLSGLREMDTTLHEVVVEEMETCNDGFIEDSRFVNGKGYASNRFPGMIFQKDPNNEYISKIRLTKDFVGKLPDGTAIDMKTLTAQEVLTFYPTFDTWTSRGCSKHWNLSNDTLAFFVRIDKTKQPQYPVDEAYYADKPIEGIDLVISCYSIFREIERKSDDIRIVQTIKSKGRDK